MMVLQVDSCWQSSFFISFPYIWFAYNIVKQIFILFKHKLNAYLISTIVSPPKKKEVIKYVCVCFSYESIDYLFKHTKISYLVPISIFKLLEFFFILTQRQFRY